MWTASPTSGSTNATDVNGVHGVNPLSVSELELFTKLKGMCPDKKIPQGLILSGIGEIQDAVTHFENARKLDANNESMPEDLSDMQIGSINLV